MGEPKSDMPQPPVDPKDNEEATSCYVVSYQRIRMWVGRLNFLFPTALFLLDWASLKTASHLWFAQCVLILRCLRRVRGVLAIMGFSDRLHVPDRAQTQ